MSTASKNRHFKVKGNIASLFVVRPDPALLHLAGIELQLWQRIPGERIFLGSGFTDTDGNFTASFSLSSSHPYMMDGQLTHVFPEAYYKGKKLTLPMVDLMQGLVAYWKLDETTGTTAADSTGRDNTGYIDGLTLPEWQSGKINNGLQIMGGGGGGLSYLRVDPSEDLNFDTGDFTIAFWFLANNISWYYGLIDARTASTDIVMLLDCVVGSSTFNLFINSDLVILQVGYEITPNTWYHMALRRANGACALFINGASVGTFNYSGAINLYDLSFGCYRIPPHCLVGKMDEIGIWKNHGLNDFEISTLYNDGIGRQYPFTT